MGLARLVRFFSKCKSCQPGLEDFFQADHTDMILAIYGLVTKKWWDIFKVHMSLPRISFNIIKQLWFFWRQNTKPRQLAIPNWIVNDSHLDSNNFVVRILSNSKLDVEIWYQLKVNINFQSISTSFQLNLSNFE